MEKDPFKTAMICNDVCVCGVKWCVWVAKQMDKVVVECEGVCVSMSGMCGC